MSYIKHEISIKAASDKMQYKKHNQTKFGFSPMGAVIYEEGLSSFMEDFNEFA